MELLARCRTQCIEPPTPGRCDRIVGAALRAAEETLTERISARLTVKSTERIVALVAGADQAGDAEPVMPAQVRVRMGGRSWGRSRRLRAM
ncbi:hypothetical protein [Streptomyces sp. NPDC048489]|uniref:hypothetical protein n=1 Tax=Streptomyces sp. NPDC048489 TaxID=3154504 RepID=UPI0034190168